MAGLHGHEQPASHILVQEWHLNNEPCIEDDQVRWALQDVCWLMSEVCTKKRVN